MSSPTLNPVPSQAQWFATTHWSVVMAAKQGDSSEADAALEKLCRDYWPPLYSYIRRQGHDVAEAQDLTQEFFARLLERDYLSRLDPQRGKFRSFLLAFVKHFLSEQRDDHLRLHDLERHRHLRRHGHQHLRCLHLQRRLQRSYIRHHHAVKSWEVKVVATSAGPE